MMLSGYWTYYFTKHHPNSLSNKCPVLSKIQWFLSFVLEWLWILSVSLINRWLFSLIAGLKLKNSLTKWQSPPQNSRDKSFFLKSWQDSCLSSKYLITLFPVLSAHLFISVSHAQLHSSKVPLRPPLNFFIHSLFLPVLPKTLLEKAFSLLAGVTKRVTSPQLTGVYSIVRVSRNLDCILLLPKTLLPWSIKSQFNRKFLCKW